jgi:HIV Tat-specific factor 1
MDKKRQKKLLPDRKNTAVYVTSLPLDVTVAEIVSVFKTCGVIAEEIDSGQPRVKLYTDPETGAPKGDALIVYFRPESVQLAIQMLDDSDFRLGEQGPAGPMRVKEADFSYKKVKDTAALAGSKKDSKDMTKIIKKTQKLNK